MTPPVTSEVTPGVDVTRDSGSAKSVQVQPGEGEFWENVSPEPNTGCWIYVGRRSSYGYTAVNGGVEATAHREAYRRVHGSIPTGAVIMHRCDNRWCCNTDRDLSAGTHLANHRDMLSKGRHGRAKFNPDRVAEIRAALAAGGRGTAAALARRFGCSRALISMISRGKRWAAFGSTAITTTN